MKNVMVTGADRGVGFALCKIFLENNWMVLACQYMTEWKQLSRLQEEYPKQLKIVQMDVGDTESVKNAAKEAGQLVEKIDLLISCAGIYKEEDTIKNMMDMFEINTMGTLRVVEFFKPMLERGEKKIAVISSEAGSISLAHRKMCFGYCMSKAALNMCVRILYNALSPKEYRFYLYHPGWVKSYMSGVKSIAGDYEPEESAEAAYQQFIETSDDVLVMKDIQGCYWSF